MENSSLLAIILTSTVIATLISTLVNTWLNVYLENKRGRGEKDKVLIQIAEKLTKMKQVQDVAQLARGKGKAKKYADPIDDIREYFLKLKSLD